MLKIMIKQFSTATLYNTNKNIRKLRELQQEKESLQSDLDSIGSAIKAASKISTGETPIEEENESLSELKDNYPAFFDSEGEQEGNSSLLNKIMGLKRYISKELSANKKSIYLLKGKGKESSLESKEFTIQTKDSSKESISETKDSSKESISETKDLSKEFIIEKGESSKRKLDDMDEGAESSSSKKIHKSTSEILDDITYNPFDDIGTD